MGGTCCASSQPEKELKYSQNSPSIQKRTESPTSMLNQKPSSTNHNRKVSSISLSNENNEADIKRRQKVDSIWEEFDDNKSGVLEKDQAIKFLKKSLAEMSGTDPTKEEIEMNFVAIDVDGNGVLDKEEVQRYLKGFEMGAALKSYFE